MKSYFYKGLLGFLCWISLASVASAYLHKEQDLLSFSAADYEWLAQKIFKNEANLNPGYLTHWNAGEDFPSLGIGHFIWLPKSAKQGNVVFEETFGQMVAFVGARVAPPLWLQSLEPFEVPWENKAQFDQAWSKKELVELRNWLLSTQAIQAEFIVNQFQKKWRDKLQTLPVKQQQRLQDTLSALVKSPRGLFAVIDYYNFKGLGLNNREQYHGKGWGLLDVLMGVSPQLNPQETLAHFVASAKHHLQVRVESSPPLRNEKRWLKGWFIRLDNYLLPE